MADEQGNPRGPLERAAGSASPNQLPGAAVNDQQDINELPQAGVQAQAEPGPPQQDDDDEEADDDDNSSQAQTLVSGDVGRRIGAGAALHGIGRGQAIGDIAGIRRAANTNINSKPPLVPRATLLTPICSHGPSRSPSRDR